MAKIEINLSGIGGLAPKHHGQLPFNSSKPNLQYIGGKDQYADGVVNPLALFGYMSPANDTTSAITESSNPPAALISCYLVAPDIDQSDDIYLGEFNAGTTTDGRILKLTTQTDLTLDVARTVAGPGGTNYPMIIDLEMYMVNGNQRMFYAWQAKNSGSSSDVGTWTTVTFDDDFMSTVPSGSGTWNGRDTETRLVIADNNFMYILEGEQVYKFDGGVTGGANGTLSLALDLDAGEQSFFLDAIDLRGRMWFAIQLWGKRPWTADYVRNDFFGQIASGGIAGVYVWDRKSTTVSMQDFIPIRGIREIRNIHDFNGVPAVFTIGANAYTQLRIWNGTGFPVVEELAEKAYPRFHDSVYIGASGMWWLGFDGLVYYYGKVVPGDKNTLYKIGDMTGHVTSTKTLDGAGALIPWGGTDTVASGNNAANLAFLASLSDDGPNTPLRKWYPHAYDPVSTDQKAYTSEVFSMVKILPKLSELKGIMLYFPTAGSGGSTNLLDVKIYINHSSSASMTKTLTQDDAQRGWAWIPFSKKNVNQVQIGLAWKAENLANNITPYMAVVEYEDTKKRF